MRLSDLHTGEKAVIAKVNGHGGFRKRLVEMGFISGKHVTVVMNAPLKDPIEYEILGYRISLRREEARMIEVVSESEAKEHIAREHAQEVLVSDEEFLINREMSELASEKGREIRVALVGNPNCGKTSLFNVASGSHEHVGNYSGVTVDAKEGRFEYGGYRFVLVDLPGTYSLSAYSPEELYVRRNLTENVPDVVINVVDASNIERNLYLTTQVIDMNLRTVIALNMYDELRSKGDKLDIPQLSLLLGAPVCPTVSRSGEGIPQLFDTVIKVYTGNDPRLARHIHINHGAEIELGIKHVQPYIAHNEKLKAQYSTRYLTIKYLEGDKDIERVTLAGNTVDVLQDAARITLIGRSHSELSMDYSHNQSRGHPFATHITDAEKEFFVADKEVEKVSPNLFGGYQLTVYVQIVTVGEGRIVLGNHIPLYVLSHTQLAVYALILQPGLMQMNKSSGRAPKDVT